MPAEPEGADSRSPERYEFGEFVLDISRGELTKNEMLVSIRPKTFEVLSSLVANHGRLVTRDQLLRSVWPDVCVTPDSVSQCIIEIRRALEDSSHKIVRTVAGRGYIFDTSPRVSGIDAVRTAPASNSVHGRVDLRPWSSRLQPVVAVLPFACDSPRSEDRLFADGMHDELISRLTENGKLRVISRTSAMLYRRSELSIPDIGKQLSAALVVEGSVQRSGEFVRTTIHLVDAHSDQLLWGEMFDRELNAENRFATQGELTTEVINHLFPAERA